MKVLKRIAIMSIIFLLFTALNVYAGATEAKLTASSTEVKVGDTVTVTLSGYRGNGIEGFDGVLVYDKTKLKLTNESSLASEGFTSISGTDDLTGEFRLSLMYIGTGTGPAEGNLAELKFEILDGAKENDTLNIKLTKVQLVDSNNTGTELEDVETNLKVIKNGSNPGGNTNTPGGNTPGGNTNTPGGNNNNNPGDYPYAGIENYIFIIIFAVGIISIAVYIKVNKYRDIK